MNPAFPSLFQIAAFFEDFFPSGGYRQPVTPARNMAIAELMMDPERLMSVLQTWQEGQVAAVASPVKEQAGKRSNKLETRNDFSQKTPSPTPEKNSGSGPRKNKEVEFSLKSPRARSVKLAGDFTNWEKSPVDMRLSKDGAWSAVISLEPGTYSYRFIVDGKWCDDPGCSWRTPNPFGGNNSIIQVS